MWKQKGLLVIIAAGQNTDLTSTDLRPLKMVANNFYALNFLLMSEPKQILEDLRTFQIGIANLNAETTTCNELHAYISEIVNYLKSNKLGQDALDTCDNQLEVSIASIGQNYHYGTKSKTSINLFNDSKSDCQRFFNRFVEYYEKTVDNT